MSEQDPPQPPSTHITPSSVTSSDTSGLRGGAPPNSSDKSYINISYVNGRLDMADLPLAANAGQQYHPEYVNIPIPMSGTGTNSDTGTEQRIENGGMNLQQRSQTVLEIGNTQHSIPAKQRSDSHVPMSHAPKPPHSDLPPRQITECMQCNDLLEWLSLWELGVSGLTRQYSQTLAQLNHVRDAATIIECKMCEDWENREKETKKGGGGKGDGTEREGGEGEGKSEEGGRSGDVMVKSPRRKTMHASMDDDMVQSLTTTVMADQMYPQQNENGTKLTEPLPQLPSDYAQHFAELTAHLGRAIDLCQQLAASSFKTKASSDLLKLKVRKSFKDTVRKQESTPLSLTLEMKRGGRSVVEPWQQLLTATDSKKRNRQRGVLTRMETEPALRTPSDASVGEREGEKKLTKSPTQSGKTGLSRSKTRCDAPRKKKLSKSSAAGDLFNGSNQDTRPVHSHMMSLIEKKEAAAGTEGEREGEMASSYLVVENDECDDGDYSLLSQVSTFSDTDVKQVMTKIAVLEDERLRLLETIDQIQFDNQRVRLSLHETVGDLENKDMQLTLAMQDLTIATDEINRVAGLRAQLDSMEKERKRTLEKLNNLEDESSAVKVSLIQLLQEKSATNKTLALENWRLRQSTGSQGDTLSRTNSRSSTAQDPSLSYITDDDLSNYVHKQGFLVKQGKRVKNWKRRLFVLDSNGLSYYKTEQPINKVSLSDIKKIQVSHNHTTPPHMFEVHTPDRVFLLSAPSEDEMRSWIGMLQTLKQYARQRSPPNPSNPSKGEPVSSTTPNGVISTDAILHQIVTENGSTKADSRVRRTPTLTTTSAVQEDQVGVVQVGGALSDKASGSPVQKRRQELMKGVLVRNGTRPRSQALIAHKGLSLDEAIPNSSRPMSVMVTTDSDSSGMESNLTTVAEGTYMYPNKGSVLSRSHPGTRAHELTPAVILET